MLPLRVAILFFIYLESNVRAEALPSSPKQDFGSLINSYSTWLFRSKGSTYELKNAEEMSSHNKILQDCSEAPKSGIYQMILPGFTSPMQVRCEAGLDSRNGKWIVIQRRQLGSVNFHRSWEDYKNGFGDLNTDFFFGLEKLHRITSHTGVELGIVLKNSLGREGRGIYSHFEIEDENNQYRIIELGAISGTIGDALHYHRYQPFSTYDRKNDGHDMENCAVSYTGGWWFRDCYQANLNGMFPYKEGDCPKCARWNTFHKTKQLKFMMMMIRPHKD